VNALAPTLTALLQSDPGQLRRRVPVERAGRSDEVVDLALAILGNAYLTNQVGSFEGGVHPP